MPEVNRRTTPLTQAELADLELPWFLNRRNPECPANVARLERADFGRIERRILASEGLPTKPAADQSFAERYGAPRPKKRKIKRRILRRA